MNKGVFSLFEQICKVPRPSLHEEQISQWLVDFAAANHIKCERDEAMNVLMRVPATPGYEDKETVILQAHMDIVAEKDNEVQHDFLKDPVSYYIDGDWMKAHGTTLGGDDGIGLSMALAVLTDKTLKHPAIEALFTVDEECGMTGAKNVREGWLKGKRVINLDNEDDGHICIGCAGGIDTLGKMHYTTYTPCFAEPMFAFHISVKNLLGGHSGDDINKGRANANKIIAGFLHEIAPYNWHLARIDGGHLRNAIAREAEADFVVCEKDKHEIIAAFNRYKADVEKVFGEVEKEMNLSLDSADMPAGYIDNARQLIQAIYDCPHGMIAMSKEIPGLVETSTNLASVKMQKDEQGEYIEIVTSQRSSGEHTKHAIKERVVSVLAQTCDEIAHSMGYPGWKPDMESPILKTALAAYRDLFHEEAHIQAVHAGLECGLFLTKYPDWDIVSIGPQMYGVHSPQERLSISSTDKCYQWLCHILESL